jgi:hypothetical protein
MAWQRLPPYFTPATDGKARSHRKAAARETSGGKPQSRNLKPSRTSIWPDEGKCWEDWLGHAYREGES